MDPYKILGVPRNATDHEIQKAYRRKAAKHHPDQGGDDWAFIQIRQAYEQILSERKPDPQKPPTQKAKPSPAPSNDIDIVVNRPTAGKRSGKRKKKTSGRAILLGSVGGGISAIVVIIIVLSYMDSGTDVAELRTQKDEPTRVDTPKTGQSSRTPNNRPTETDIKRKIAELQPAGEANEPVTGPTLHDQFIKPEPVADEGAQPGISVEFENGEKLEIGPKADLVEAERQTIKTDVYTELESIIKEFDDFKSTLPESSTVQIRDSYVEKLEWLEKRLTRKKYEVHFRIRNIVQQSKDYYLIQLGDRNQQGELLSLNDCLDFIPKLSWHGSARAMSYPGLKMGEIMEIPASKAERIDSNWGLQVQGALSVVPNGFESGISHQFYQLASYDGFKFGIVNTLKDRRLKLLSPEDIKQATKE